VLPVEVSGTRETKAQFIKAALGLAGPTTVSLPDPSCKSIVDYVKKSENLTILDAAISVSGLTSLLSNPSLVATAFLPTDSGVHMQLRAPPMLPPPLLTLLH
jgi:hypothetical protein